MWMATCKGSTCGVCKVTSKKWSTCDSCGQVWCLKCDKSMVSNGYVVNYPPEMKGKVKYKCPFCNYVYISGCKYLSPRKTTVNCCIL